MQLGEFVPSLCSNHLMLIFLPFPIWLFLFLRFFVIFVRQGLGHQILFHCLKALLKLVRASILWEGAELILTITFCFLSPFRLFLLNRVCLMVVKSFCKEHRKLLLDGRLPITIDFCEFVTLITLCPQCTVGLVLCLSQAGVDVCLVLVFGSICL